MWFLTLFCLVMVGQVFGKGFEIEGRITQGKEAEAGQIPYQVQISFLRGGKRKSCGGTIISKKYMLTAAHCVDDEFISNPTKQIIMVGSILRNNGTIIPIDKAYRHPNYNRSTNDNDAALLRATSDIEFTDNIKSVNLPATNRELTGTVRISGWGRTKNDDKERPINLMYADIPVVPKDKCDSAYAVVTENMFCAGDYENGGPNTCLGDSGGPAVQDDIVVGITSWGHKSCGGPLKPQVYVNVASPSIRDFISTITEL